MEDKTGNNFDNVDGRELSIHQDQIKEVEAELLQTGLQPPQAERAVRVFQRFALKVHRGPLPPAEDFAAYDQVYPGAAKEILAMATRQQIHFHECEKLTVEGELKYRNFGIIAAVVVVSILIFGTVICAVYGQTAAALALGAITGITTLAGAFIKGRNLFDQSGTTKVTEPPKAQVDTLKKIQKKGRRK